MCDCTFLPVLTHIGLTVQSHLHHFSGMKQAKSWLPTLLFSALACLHTGPLIKYYLHHWAHGTGWELIVCLHFFPNLTHIGSMMQSHLHHFSGIKQAKNWLPTLLFSASACLHTGPLIKYYLRHWAHGTGWELIVLLLNKLLYVCLHFCPNLTHINPMVQFHLHHFFRYKTG